MEMQDKQIGREEKGAKKKEVRTSSAAGSKGRRVKLIHWSACLTLPLLACRRSVLSVLCVACFSDIRWYERWGDGMDDGEGSSYIANPPYFRRVFSIN